MASSSSFADVVLNDQQSRAYDIILEGKSMLLSGEAGTGKTEIVRKFFSKSGAMTTKKIALTSTTGTSALLIGGVTIHSYLGIGLGTGSVDQLVHTIRSKKYILARWTELDVLVIDEISLLHPDLFDKLNLVAQAIRRKNGVPWGGIQLLLSGDFLQLPVVGKANTYTFEAKTWEESIEHVVILTHNMRQSGDDEWRRTLSEIRVGTVTDFTVDLLNSRVGAKVGSQGVKPTKLFTTNAEVDSLNEEGLDNMARANPDLVFVEYETKPIGNEKVKWDLVQQSIDRCIAMRNLQLCVGAQVMLLVNKSDDELSNGSRGVVQSFSLSNLPIVRFVNGKVKEVGAHEFQINDANNLPIFTLSQIPLKIAYAISIHKSQGMTVDCVEANVSSCFCDGQAYVALSRVKTIEGLSLLKKVNKGSIVANQKCVDFYKRHL